MLRDEAGATGSEEPPGLRPFVGAGPTGGVGTAAPPVPLHRRMRAVLLGLWVIDVVVLTLVSMLAWLLRGPIDSLLATQQPPDGLFPSYAGAVIGAWALLLLAVGAYQFRTFGSGFEEFRAIVAASALTLALVTFIGFLVRSDVSRGYPVLFALLGAPALLVTRYLDRKVLHFARRRGRLVHRTIAVGSAQAVAEIVTVLGREKWTGYRVIGSCVPGSRSELESAQGSGVPVLGHTQDVRGLALEHAADTVLVAGGSFTSSRDLRRLGWEIEGLGLDLLVVPSLTDVAGPRIHMRYVSGLPLIHVEEAAASAAGGAGKRLFDVLVASLLLVALAVPMLVVALLVRRDGGPAFYRQRRVGINGQPFSMVKFRSMVVDADRVREELEASNESDGLLFKMRSDPRVTPTGRVLRAYSVDEVPQLLNVVRGEMSLVGPRPPLPREVEQYDEVVHRRLMVRPGMTGLWQVSGRSDLSWEESVRLDLYYVDNWSLVSDLMIMLKTVKAVFVSDGAY